MNDRVNAALLNATYALLVSARRTQGCSINYFSPCSHIFINIFQTVHFSAIKFTRVSEKKYDQTFRRLGGRNLGKRKKKRKKGERRKKMDQVPLTPILGTMIILPFCYLYNTTNFKYYIVVVYYVIFM